MTTEAMQAEVRSHVLLKDTFKPAMVHIETVASEEPQERMEPAVKNRRNGERGYYRNEELGGPIHSEKHMRIIVCGAGASALCFAYKLQRSFDNFSLHLFEKNTDISGTWFENRYPGCACDVPSHTYTFSWEPKPDWTAVYAGSEEIKCYFKEFATKYNLWQYISVQHEIIRAEWDDLKGEWTIRERDSNGTVHQHQCDIFINASGILNNWQWPGIKGLNTFKGPLLHSANYNTDINLEGKRVGLIGNGSSGIQILPALQPLVKHISTFIRSSTWVTPLRGFEQHRYTDAEKGAFKSEPGVLLNWRKNAETNVNNIFPMFLRGSKLQERTKKAVMHQMETKLTDPELRKRLIPEWDFGCRRMTPGVGYLDALQKDNVQVIVGEIDEITPSGCVANGNHHELDVIICATGFNVSFKPRFPIIGQKGQNLQDLWKTEAHSYMGLGAPEQPNYMHFLGPNCPIGSGPLVGAIEAQADYILKWCDRWQTEMIHSFTPKPAAIEDFTAWTGNFMRDTIWASGCRSWYKSHTIDGRVSALWPGSSLHYFEALQYPRAEDWDISCKGNRFSWLGNGFSQTECDLTADWAYYIREEDNSPFLSKGKRRKIMTMSGTVEREPEVDESDDEALTSQEWKAWC